MITCIGVHFDNPQILLSVNIRCVNAEFELESCFANSHVAKILSLFVFSNPTIRIVFVFVFLLGLSALCYAENDEFHQKHF